MSYEIKRASNYSILEVDLSQAHDEEEIYIPGDTLAVIAIDGTLDASLDDPDAPTIEVDRITRVVTRPEKWTYLYISNAAQAGKSATLYIGREASFESVPQRTGNVGILDTTATQIDPRTESSIQKIVTGAAIDATGTIITLDTRGKQVIDIGLDATAADADYSLDASPDNTNWFNDYYTWAAVGEIKEGFHVGARYVRIRVTTASGTAGATADVFIGASG